MSFLFSLLLLLHLIGAAVLLGTWIATFRRPTVTTWQFAAAIVQLVTGLAMTGLGEANPDIQMNHAWVAVKAVIALIVFVAALIGWRKASKGQEVSTGLAHAVGGMTLINMAVAVLWH